MQQNTYNYLFKVTLVGDEGVGKSCLLQQYLSNQFVSTYDPTTWVDFGAKLVPIDDLNIKLQIWDTSGYKSSITRSYYKVSAATLLVYSIKWESFDRIPTWLEELKEYGNPNQVIILVGNMSDLIDERQVTFDEAQQFAQTHGLHFFEVSAKNHKSLEELFKHLCQLILINVIAGVVNPNESTGVKFGPQKKQNNEKGHTNQNQEG